MGGFGGVGGGQAGGRAQTPAAPAGTQVAEFVLHGAVVNRFQEKAAFSAATNIYTMATPPVPAADVVRKADVIDLTSRMRPDGTLDWTPPAGRWVVLRIGYSLTGPAEPARVARGDRPRGGQAQQAATSRRTSTTTWTSTRTRPAA